MGGNMRGSRDQRSADPSGRHPIEGSTIQGPLLKQWDSARLEACVAFAVRRPPAEAQPVALT